MRKKYHCQLTPDLFDLPEPMPAFKKEEIRAGTVEGKIAKGISGTLKEDSRSREEIAEEMSIWLSDEKMTKNMLDAYASFAREEYKITLARFWALTVTTGDVRILQEIAKDAGYMVIKEQYGSRIKQAVKDEKIAWHRAKIADLEAHDD